MSFHLNVCVLASKLMFLSQVLNLYVEGTCLVEILQECIRLSPNEEARPTLRGRLC